MPPETPFDVAVIGAGTAGLAAWRAATAQGARAVLIEAGPGGTLCAREGCMPSKLLIAAAEAAHQVADAPAFGVGPGLPMVDGPAVLERVRRERDRFVGLVLDGVDRIPADARIQGRARLVGAGRLLIDGQRMVQARAVVLATGSVPRTLPFAADLGELAVQSDAVFQWKDLPDSLIVFGPGAIGLELGQALHRLGVRVRIVGRGHLLGAFSDPTVRRVATMALRQELLLDTDARVERVWREGDRVMVRGLAHGETFEEDFALALLAVGRAPATAHLGLQSLGIDPEDLRVHHETLQVGDLPLFVAGDATGERALLHEAADEGRIAGENAARFPDVRPGHRRTPLSMVFSDPQLAVVGRSWQSLQGQDFVTGAVDLGDQGRSRVMRQNRGWLHLYAEPGSGRLLGAELAHPRAEHLAHELAWLVDLGVTVQRALQLPFYHPVVEEGLRTALRDAASKL